MSRAEHEMFKVYQKEASFKMLEVRTLGYYRNEIWK